MEQAVQRRVFSMGEEVTRQIGDLSIFAYNRRCNAPDEISLGGRGDPEVREGGVGAWRCDDGMARLG